MKTGIIGTAALSAAAAAGITAWLIAPGHASTEMKALFMHRTESSSG